MAELTKEQLAAIDNYSNDIQTLKDTVTAIRQLPGMYCSGRGNIGFRSLGREIYQNSIDQVVDPTSPADTIYFYYNELTLEVIVADNGKGFPFNDMVRIVTAQHTSKNYTKKKGEYSRGLHGSGLKVVNALSTKCSVISYKYDGTAKQLDLEEGYVVGNGPYDIPNKSKKQGSVVKFIPSTEVLGDINLGWKSFYTLIKDILSLTPLGSKVLFEAVDSNNVKHTETIINKDGIITKLISTVNNPLCKPIVIGYDNGEYKIDVAFCYDMNTEDTISDTEYVTAFCNMCPTIAGEHITGTIDGITRWFTNYMNNIYLASQKSKDKLKVIGNDIKSGLNVMISGFCLEVTFVGQAKEQLSVPEMGPFAKSTVMKGLDEWSKANPQDLQKLCKFFKDMAEIRLKQEGAKTKIVSKYQKNPINNLPRKYKKPINKTGIELIIVEGDSALGSAETDRNPYTQGLFPIRGKIINAFKCSKQAFFSNEEVQGITQIIFGQEYRKGLTVEDAKVEKIIFMADADIDGAHISALLLRMFVMYFPFLIEAGMVYKAIPPLYSIKEGKKRRYFTENIDYIKYNQKIFLDNNVLTDLSKNPINSKDITKFFLVNADYIYNLEKVANTYCVDPYLLEIVLLHYISNKNNIKIDKLRKEIKSVYRFMDVFNKNGIIVVQGTIDASNTIIMHEKFLNDCREVFKIINDNDSLYYMLNGKKASLYTIMKAYKATTPSNRQRYKGLGEMNDGELGESTLRPDGDRTLVRYTLEDAKEAINVIREYETDTKKILTHVGSVSRDDLAD